MLLEFTQRAGLYGCACRAARARQRGRNSKKAGLSPRASVPAGRMAPSVRVGGSGTLVRKPRGSSRALLARTPPRAPRCRSHPKARGRADLGAWSRADGCYFVPLRCGARWVGARVEATDGAARPRSSGRPPSSLTFRRRRAARLRTSKRRAALKPGAAFLLEDALASSAAGREDEDALACLRFARRGDDRSERDERGVEDASREPIENAIEVFEEEDDREDADRENAPDPPGEEAEAPARAPEDERGGARAALLRERNNGDDAFGS